MRVRVLAALAAATALVAPAQAAGASKATVEATKFGVDSFESAEERADCAGGRQAVGGGVVQEGPLEFDYQLQASAPTLGFGFPGAVVDGDDPLGWYTVLRGASDGNRARAFAVCEKGLDATVEVTEIAVPAMGDAEGFAECPGALTALGGGVAPVSSPPAAFTVHAAGPLDGSGVTLSTNDGDIPVQWYASVESLSNVEEQVKVFAICADAPRAAIEAKEFEATEFTAKRALASCPGRKRVLGGGVVQSGDASSVSTLVSGPVDASGKPRKTKSGDVPKSWYAGVTHYQATQVRTFRVFAVCG